MLRAPVLGLLPNVAVRLVPRLASTSSATAAELHAWRDGTDTDGWVHMNAAGASPTPKPAHEAVLSHLNLERRIGGYAAAAERSVSAGRIPSYRNEHAHEALATLLNCQTGEIALTESAQLAWARAFSSMDFRPGDRVICWSSEYAGNAVAYLQAAKLKGAVLQVLPLHSNGIADIGTLEAALRDGTREGSRCLVSLAHVQADSSVVQPAAEVGALARAHGAVYLLDACQSIGQMPVDVKAIGCDFACGTGRKWLRGPRGTGFLYARAGVVAGSGGLVGEPGIIDHTGTHWLSANEYEVSHEAKRFEFWESSEAGRAGLAAAVDFCNSVGIERIATLANQHASTLRDGLRSIPGVVMRDAPPSFDSKLAAASGASQGAVVGFEAETTLGIPSQTFLSGLTDRRIGVSLSPSFHTFDDTAWIRPHSVRISPSYFNTDKEVSRVLAAVREIVEENKAD